MIEMVFARIKPPSYIACTFLFLILILTGCNGTATETVLADSFFSGYAFLDANGNGQLDETDTPLENATFIVTLQGGAEFADQTDQTGNAFITIPSSVEYPVTLRMEAPEGSTLAVIGKASISSMGMTPVKFLFSEK